MAFYQKTKDGYVLRVRLTPNSSCCCIKEIIQNSGGEDFVKINVVSVPEKGKANKELVDFLAKKLKLPKSCFEVITGQTDRWKKISIQTSQNLDLIMEKWAHDGENY